MENEEKSTRYWTKTEENKNVAYISSCLKTQV